MTDRHRVALLLQKSGRAILRHALWVVLLVGAAGLAGALSPSSASAAPSRAEIEAFVKSVGEQALSLAAAYHVRRDDRDREALEALIRRSFDIDGGTRFVLGRYWNDATPAQREKLISLLPDYAMEVATRTLSSLKVHEVRNFRVVGSRPFGDADTLVETSIQIGDAEPFVVGWRVHDDNGRPKIVDAVVQGVSMAVTIREAVDSVILREGIDGLITEVQNKLRQLRASK